ncbi:MAG: methylmalonyl-CoA epimerase [Pyrinomonadaceae bacterium]|nr:methylmalonyl-CoA epimerase [Sphingobacteriaceae bacterium]
MNKIDHIGIAVRSIASTAGIYEKLLGVKSFKCEELPDEALKVEFFEAGNGKIELLEATSSDSVIAKFIEKKGEGIHHIAFDVQDIYAEMKRLKAEGFTLLSDEAKPGADNKLICFVHPKDTSGVLIELCQQMDFKA